MDLHPAGPIFFIQTSHFTPCLRAGLGDFTSKCRCTCSILAQLFFHRFHRADSTSSLRWQTRHPFPSLPIPSQTKRSEADIRIHPHLTTRRSSTDDSTFVVSLVRDDIPNVLECVLRPTACFAFLAQLKTAWDRRILHCLSHTHTTKH